MPGMRAPKLKGKDTSNTKAETAIEFAKQSKRLAQFTPEQEDESTGSTQAVEAKFITGQDPVIQTADGARLPAVPVDEAIKLNQLKDALEGKEPTNEPYVKAQVRESKDGTIHGARTAETIAGKSNSKPDAVLREAVPPSRTNPLFPPLPMYGPPTLMRVLHSLTFRACSAVLSLCFLLVIVLGAAFTSIPTAIRHVWMTITFRDPCSNRIFYEEENRRRKTRKEAEKAWVRDARQNGQSRPEAEESEAQSPRDEYVPLEGGPDKLLCDVGYYARRVGLDCETFLVQTEDGFIIELWHLYNPREYTPAPEEARNPKSPDIFKEEHLSNPSSSRYLPNARPRYPVLLIHGLLQSAGAYCVNDESSLAFYLHKSGYDVWLGNNRCGFNPRHTLLKTSDPRMWAWNIRQMGVLDLPALISRVLKETSFPKLALVAHSQGTTQTLVALAKEQRPDIGSKISVFCALAPAAYAGPLIGKMYFKFMRVVPPSLFRLIFGIHAFIPFMMKMHALLPSRFYGAMGYRVFGFLFDWSDSRWERDLRPRFFQFSPVYVSAESMRWWLGRECFARQKCILATREEKKLEDREDAEEDRRMEQYMQSGRAHPSEKPVPTAASPLERDPGEDSDADDDNDNDTAAAKQKQQPPRTDSGRTDDNNNNDDKGKYAWYGPTTPPFALWVCGADDLVDGRRLLRRFERGREPFARVVHAKVIEGYEHLDVLWAMDAIEQVGREVKEVIWKTAAEEQRRTCRVPTGCGGVAALKEEGGDALLDEKVEHVSAELPN